MRDSVWGIKVSEWVHALGKVPLLRCHLCIKLAYRINTNSILIVLIRKRFYCCRFAIVSVLGAGFSTS